MERRRGRRQKCKVGGGEEGSNNLKAMGLECRRRETVSADEKRQRAKMTFARSGLQQLCWRWQQGVFERSASKLPALHFPLYSSG